MLRPHEQHVYHGYTYPSPHSTSPCIQDYSGMISPSSPCSCDRCRRSHTLFSGKPWGLHNKRFDVRNVTQALERGEYSGVGVGVGVWVAEAHKKSFSTGASTLTSWNTPYCTPHEAPMIIQGSQRQFHCTPQRIRVTKSSEAVHKQFYPFLQI